MTQQTKQKSPHTAETDEYGPEPVPQPKAEQISKDTADLLEDLDALLADNDEAKKADDIDDILAEVDELLTQLPAETVANFRQQGGQ